MKIMTTTTAAPVETAPIETLPTSEADILAQLRAMELDAVTSYTLADAMREGSTVTGQEYGWGSGANACALSAARLAARARGYIA
jgi:hypothetical protein